MKNILLIGLGRFGKHIALQLNKLGHEVMAVDSNEERINKILPIVTNAQIGDSTNTEFLKSLGIGNFDVCIVTIGGNFQNSLETTSLLKELGAKLVVSRAERDVQAKFLLRNGADEVVYPEKQVRCLMQNKNLVMSREQLLVKCWGYDYEGESRAVDTHIKRLREKLGDYAECIKTVIKAGYRLEG